MSAVDSSALENLARASLAQDREIADLRAQLAAVTAERDQLRRLLPNWELAPKGAVCAVMDENGRWSWHDGEPVPCRDMWSLGCYLGDVHFGAWKTTLQRRPETR